MQEPIDNLFNHERAIITHSDEEVCAKVNRILSVQQTIRNTVKICPVCKSNIEDRRVTLFRELIQALYNVYKWCGQHKCHEFKTNDIIHLLNKNCYARFGDLVKFGGIIYRPKDDDDESAKAWFGINMKRAKEFYAGKREIPVQITLNQITGEIIDAKYVKIGDFPALAELITTDGLYDYEIDLINI